MHRGPTEMPTPNASEFGRRQSRGCASPAMVAAQPDFGSHHSLEPEAVNPTVVAARADCGHRAMARPRPVRRERWKNGLSTPGRFGRQAGIGAVTALFDLASRTRLPHAGCAKSPGAAPPGRLERRRSPYRRAAFSCAMDLESDNECLNRQGGCSTPVRCGRPQWRRNLALSPRATFQHAPSRACCWPTSRVVQMLPPRSAPRTPLSTAGNRPDLDQRPRVDAPRIDRHRCSQTVRRKRQIGAPSGAPAAW